MHACFASLITGQLGQLGHPILISLGVANVMCVCAHMCAYIYIAVNNRK